MDDPPSQIPHVIHLLTQTPPSTQRATIEKYFTPNASFTHPFCRTGSWDGSRWLIWCIYRWYKILSPRIEMSVESVSFDAQNLILYVSLRQVFQMWFLGWLGVGRADVALVTVLRLVRQGGGGGEGKGLYLIRSQNDLYQVNEFVKFVSVFGVLGAVVYVWQFVATLFCVVGAAVFWPVSWVEQRVVGGNAERGLGDVVEG